MLVSFKVSNFLSFNKEQTFSMIPSLSDETNIHLVKIKNVRLLKMGIILGANSSGKSNLLKSIAVGKDLITGTSPLKYRNFFCKIDKENRDKETLFEFSFFYKKQFYTYGYTINLFTGKYLTEYLYNHDLDTDQEQVIFERISIDNNLEPLFTYRLEMNNNLRKRFDKYLKDFNNSGDTLFISKIYLDKDLSKQIKEFKDVFLYFQSMININFQTLGFKVLNLSIIDQREEVNELLKTFDTGIEEVLLEEIDLNFIESTHKESYDDLINYIESRKEENNFSFSVRINNSMYSLKYIDGDLHIYKILLKHFFADLAFEFFEESDGVKRLFDLFDILLAAKEHSVYIFDELNRCIHPLLIIKFIETFNKKLLNIPLQLIFTTHEANILKENLLRRDEIWFVEKERDNSSKLYSLDIFKLTKKKMVESYLDGNFGAIPIFIKDE